MLIRIISEHREGVGLLLIGSGILGLMGVACTDDYNTMIWKTTPLIVLAIKTLIGLIVTTLGVIVLNKGGAK